MISRTTTLRALQEGFGDLGRSGARWSVGWWHVVKVGALILVLALTPSTYTPANRRSLAAHVVLDTSPLIPWFALISALISLVIIRIVVVTAVSYGLTQYALEMVIRMLVLELIPLAAALFVALRSTVPAGSVLVRMHRRGEFDALTRAGLDPLRHELLPRVVAGIFGVLLLAALSCAIATLLAYLAIYGFTLGGIGGFTRTMGQVFHPAVALILSVKTLLFALAVSLIPVAAFLRGRVAGATTRTSPELESLVRLFAAILLIEVASLVGNYY